MEKNNQTVCWFRLHFTICPFHKWVCDACLFAAVGLFGAVNEGYGQLNNDTMAVPNSGAETIQTNILDPPVLLPSIGDN